MLAQRRWTSWLMVAVLFTMVATHYGIWTETIDITSLTNSATSYLVNYPTKFGAKPSESVPDSATQASQLTTESTTEPSSCIEPVKPLYLDTPREYERSSAEDLLCEKFYTEKYIQTIATKSRSLCNNGSIVTEFEVPTHPSHRKLNKATPVWLLQGVHWDPNTTAFVAQSDEQAERPFVYGVNPLSALRYARNSPGCASASASERQVIVYPILWEGTYSNIWHRLLELWQSKLSFDAMRIAIDPDTGKPYLTAEQAAKANVVFPDGNGGPWAELWEIVTDSPALPPSILSPDICYDVVVPSVGWASPFWSALLSSSYDSCPRQTLMTTFVNRVLRFYNIPPRTAAEVNARKHPSITIIQRGDNRKFQDFDRLLEALHERHPESSINVVDLTLLSKRQQIALAYDTDVWVAHHGAGMLFQLFMQRNAAVVEILPPLFVSRGFRWIARMRGLVHFIGRAMWKVEYEERYKGVPKPLDWRPERQADSDANNWQFEEWVWISHEEILDLVGAAVLSQMQRSNDLG